MIFDSHAHYDDKQFDEDREEVLLHLKDAGVERVVNISNGWDDMLRSFVLIEKYPFMYGTAGIHPCKVSDLNEERMEELRQYCRRDKIVAVGEIGLDYYWKEPERAVQKQWFEAQMELAREVKLPMIIHSRDAAKDTYDMMKAAGAGEMGGVVHCYSYSKEMAENFLNMGFYIGVGGVVTFKNARTLKETVQYAPLDRILLETDCPYLAPEPNRGKRNSSLNLIYVAEAIAQIKGISAAEVIAATEQNAKKVYRMEGR